MKENPFAAFNIEIPNKYRDSVIKHCRSNKTTDTIEFCPFERQIDFWFVAFLFAVNKRLLPEKETDTYNATAAHILSTDDNRISLMQISFLGLTKDISKLSDAKYVFDYCSGLANAGMPHLIQILKDEDNRPLWSVLEEIESITKKYIHGKT